MPIINAPLTPGSEDGFYVSEEMYRTYVSAGERLRKMHLMQIETPAQLTLEPNTADDLTIGAIKFSDGVLQLNKSKRILGISEEVWNYRIGGYLILDKWLKSHKGETLTRESFKHIRNVAGLLAETIKIQEELSNMR